MKGRGHLARCLCFFRVLGPKRQEEEAGCIINKKTSPPPPTPRLSCGRGTGQRCVFGKMSTGHVCSSLRESWFALGPGGRDP